MRRMKPPTTLEVLEEISSLGAQPVYDATVPGTHNFVANGIAVHNSIEQDADMVILLHREDAYEKESPRAGEAWTRAAPSIPSSMPSTCRPRRTPPSGVASTRSSSA